MFEVGVIIFEGYWSEVRCEIVRLCCVGVDFFLVKSEKKVEEELFVGSKKKKKKKKKFFIVFVVIVIVIDCDEEMVFMELN